MKFFKTEKFKDLYSKQPYTHNLDCIAVNILQYLLYYIFNHLSIHVF